MTPFTVWESSYTWEVLDEIFLAPVKTSENPVIYARNIHVLQCRNKQPIKL